MVENETTAAETPTVVARGAAAIRKLFARGAGDSESPDDGPPGRESPEREPADAEGKAEEGERDMEDAVTAAILQVGQHIESLRGEIRDLNARVDAVSRAVEAVARTIDQSSDGPLDDKVAGIERDLGIIKAVLLTKDDIPRARKVLGAAAAGRPEIDPE